MDSTLRHSKLNSNHFIKPHSFSLCIWFITAWTSLCLCIATIVSFLLLLLHTINCLFTILDIFMFWKQRNKNDFNILCMCHKPNATQSYECCVILMRFMWVNRQTLPIITFISFECCAFYWIKHFFFDASRCYNNFVFYLHNASLCIAYSRTSFCRTTFSLHSQPVY